jgi:hypothetical protein
MADTPRRFEPPPISQLPLSENVLSPFPEEVKAGAVPPLNFHGLKFPPASATAGIHRQGSCEMFDRIPL